MSRWKRGEATVAKTVDRPSPPTDLRRDERGAGVAGQGRQDLVQCGPRRGLGPGKCARPAYDAGRQIGTGLLAQQGLRPTTAGGHVAVTRAVIDQFNGRFTGLDALRRRNELQYPLYPGDLVESHEAEAAIATVRGLLVDASALLPSIGFFTER